MTDEATSRAERLAGYLELDPENPALLGDLAQAAFEEQRLDLARDSLRQLEALGPLSPQLLHLSGLVEMARLDWAAAVERFTALYEAGFEDPAVRYNLAWSLAMSKDFGAALPLLDEATSDALPQAAELEVELLHQLGEFERAGERARLLIDRHPDHRGLNAAVSTLAVDIEDLELAERTARQAGDHPDALITLGTLALGEDEPEPAMALFDAALARNPDAPRAWIGRGLVQLLGEDKVAAARDLDRGAELFGTHIGSWVGAGWAHLIAGDRETARERFDAALALDDSFGESQGSLAVVDILDGRIEEARRRTEVALRLDRRSFSAAFASMLLAAGDGDRDAAQRILDAALRAPAGADGKTLADSLARLGLRAG